MIGRVACLVVVLVASAPPASAGGGNHSPTVWERAIDPTARMCDAAHHAATTLRSDAAEMRSNGQRARALETWRQARRILESAGARSSPDVRLRYDYGLVLSDLNDDADAAAVLESALAQAPDHVLAVHALSALAISLARLDRTEQEILAHDRYLLVQTGTLQRAIALYNRADAKMRLGRVLASIEDYRASLLLQPDVPVVHWGLAVALDRSGDPSGAAEEVERALRYDPLNRQLDSPDVFFVPAYERYYYAALGAMVHAGRGGDPLTAVPLWEEAAVRWSQYAAAAGPSDRWYALAVAHKVQCERRLDRARRQRRAVTQRP